MSNEVFIDGDADAIQLRVQGNTTQTNPLQTWEDSSANVLAQVDENGQVLIDGQQNQVQLRVQAHSAQTNALQTWEDPAGDTLAQITGDGRLELGDLDLGTPDGLIEANRDITLPSTVPQRGVQSQGKVTGDGTNVIDGAIAWAVHELELLGDAVVSGVHAALRGKITRKNTSTSPQAELRAADFEAINDTASGANSVGKLVGVQSAVTNEEGAHLGEAVGVEVHINDNNTPGQITGVYGLRVDSLPAGSSETYAIHTGEGSVHVGDDLEVKVFADPPVENPPSEFIKMYPKLDAGGPRLYAKDSDGYEHVLGGGVEKYSARVKNTCSTNLVAYWQLNESSGATAADSSGNGYDAAYHNVTLDQEGIGDGSGAPLFDGSTSYINAYSAGLAGAFNGAAGSLMIWFKASAGVWVDDTSRCLVNFIVDSYNHVSILKSNNTNRLYASYCAGAVTEQIDVQFDEDDTDWHFAVITWDSGADEVKFFLDAAQWGDTQTGLGVWEGTPAAQGCAIGSSIGVLAFAVWDGSLAHAALWDVALSAAEIDSLAKISIEADVAANTTHRQTTSGNPHNVTASEIGNTTAQWNADQIQGRTVASTTPNDGQALVWDSASNLWKPGTPLEHYRTPAPMVRRVNDSLLAVLHGVAEVDNTEVGIVPLTLDMATAGDWLEGSSQEAANQMVYVYLSAAGDLKLSNRAPAYPRADLTSMVFTALVNQAGWNGTASLGLDATSVVYYGDTGEANLKAGMWLGVCASDDSDYSKWRGAGSGSTGGKSVPGQYAFIEDINTSTNTLTLRTGHNIAINDDDHLFAISGTPQYRYESSQWWRCIGALWNDGNQDLAEGLNGYTSYELEKASSGNRVNTTSTSFVAVDATNLVLQHVNFGGGVEVGFHGTAMNTVSGYYTSFTVEVDGILLGGANGVVRTDSTISPTAFTRFLPYLAPGMHTYKLMFRTNNSAGTARLFWNNDGGQFWVKEC